MLLVIATIVLLLASSTFGDVCPSSSRSLNFIPGLSITSSYDSLPLNTSSCEYTCQSLHEDDQFLNDDTNYNSFFLLTSCDMFEHCYGNSQQIPANESPTYNNGLHYVTQTLTHPPNINIFIVTCILSIFNNNKGEIEYSRRHERHIYRNLPDVIALNNTYNQQIGDPFSHSFLVTRLQDTHSCSLFSSDVKLMKELKDGHLYPVDSSILSTTRSRCTIIDDELFLAIYMFTIATTSFQSSMTGFYQVLVPSLNSSENFTIEFGDFCQISYYHGLVWSTLGPGQIEVQSCSYLGANFAKFGTISLSCISSTPTHISLVSECFLINKSNVIQLILISQFELNSRNLDPIISELSDQLTLEVGQFTYNYVQHPTLKTEITHLQMNIADGDTIYLNNIREMILEYFMTSPKFGYSLLDIAHFTSSETCHCQFEITNSYPSNEFIYEVCPYSACGCKHNESLPLLACQCQPGHTGSQTECGIDTDNDTYPNYPLNCFYNTSHPLCISDNCPMDSNTNQSDCDMNGYGDVCDGPICPANNDMYGIFWECGVGNEKRHPGSCPEGYGISYRRCGFDGEWLKVGSQDDTDLTLCISAQYGAPLDNCSFGLFTMSDIANILVSIESGLIGVEFKYYDMFAFTQLFQCITLQSIGSQISMSNATFISLYLSATQTILERFKLNKFAIIYDVIANLTLFSKFIQLQENSTFNFDCFELNYFILTNAKNSLDTIFITSDLASITLPSSLLQEAICDTCSNLTFTIVSYPAYNFKSLLSSTIMNSNDVIVLSNGIYLNYYRQPEIISSIFSLQFGPASAQTTNLQNSFSITYQERNHSFSPFTINDYKVNPVCVFAISNKLWRNPSTLANSTVFPYRDITLCRELNSEGIYTLLGAVGHLEDTRRPLNIIGYIGCSIAFIICTVTILLYLCHLRLIVKMTHFLHFLLNLATCAFFGLFILAAEPAFINIYACRISGVFLHFLVLSLFIWLLMESFIVYILVAYPHYRFKKRLYAFLVLLVTNLFVSAILVFPLSGYFHYEYLVQPTNNDDSLDERFGYCWVTFRSDDKFYFIWLVVGPLIAIFVLTLLMLTFTLIKGIVQSFALKSSKLLSRVLFIYIFIFGINWMLFFAFVETNSAALAYIFSIFNTFQALFLLLCIIILPHPEVHNAIDRKRERTKKLSRIFKRKTTPRTHIPRTIFANRAVQKAIPEETSQDVLIAATASSQSIADSKPGDENITADTTNSTPSQHEIDITNPDTFAPPTIHKGELTELLTSTVIMSEEMLKQEKPTTIAKDDTEMTIYYAATESSKSSSSTLKSDSSEGVNLNEIIIEKQTLEAPPPEVTTHTITTQDEVLMSGYIVEGIFRREYIIEPAKAQARYAELMRLESTSEDELLIKKQLQESKKLEKKVNMKEFWERKIAESKYDESGIKRGILTSITDRNYDKNDQNYLDTISIKTETGLLHGGYFDTTPSQSGNEEEMYTQSMPELLHMSVIQQQQDEIKFDMRDKELETETQVTLVKFSPGVTKITQIIENREKEISYHKISREARQTLSLDNVEKELVEDLDTLVQKIELENVI